MDITLLYFDACPSWKVADERLSVIASERPDVTITHQRVETSQEAETVGFLGSPSIHVDGVDVFAEPGAAAGLSCRRYVTPHGHEGSPTLDQLRAVLAHV